MVTKFYHPRIGGVETTARELCENLVRMGHQCTVITQDPERSGEETIGGVRVVRFPVDSKAFGGMNRHIGRYLKKNLGPERFDLVHIHSYHILLSAQAAYLCRKKGAPLVFSTHYHGKGHTPLRELAFRAYHPIGKRVLSWSREVIAVSEHEKGLLLKDFPKLEGRIAVIPNGVKELPPLEVERRMDTLLYVGRVMPYKGIDHAMEAIGLLKNEGFGAKLRIVGKGPAEKELRLLAHRLGISDQVTWLGDLEEADLNREYRSAGALVLLSAAEAYGLVVAEAMSCGTPAIVAKKEALVEFLNEPGCVGVDFPPKNEDVARTFRDVLEGRLATSVGPFSDKIAPWSRIAEKYQALYENVVTSGK
ncbi:MAG: glycosyltransferase family 4 protein [Methanomassiliicoccales archaeon]|nr:glycosyltransferase family 4 protein [Methanomassiliicoccales archaeon]